MKHKPLLNEESDRRNEGLEPLKPAPFTLPMPVDVRSLALTETEGLSIQAVMITSRQ